MSLKLNKTKVYKVLAIFAYHNNETYYLIFNESDSVVLYEAHKFEIVNHVCEPFWVAFNIDKGDHSYTNGHIEVNNVFIVGYEELMTNKTHLVNIIDSPTDQDKIILKNNL